MKKFLNLNNFEEMLRKKKKMGTVEKRTLLWHVKIYPKKIS